MNVPTKPDALAEFPIVITLPIQWGDQDAFGHVNNTIAIRWFESARIAYLGGSGMEDLLSRAGLGPILASITCHYRLRLKYPDTVQVEARVTRIGNSSMTIEHAVYSQQQEAIAADGDTVVVVFDYAANTPRRVPDDVCAAVEKLEGRSY